jgi:calcium binding hemolysin protein, putative
MNGFRVDTSVTITSVTDNVSGGVQDGGVVAKGGKTNDSTPTIKGTAAANSEVSIFDNGTFIGKTTSDKNGNFTFESSALKDGSHTFTAKTQYSEKSEGFSFTVDTQASIDMTVSDAKKDDINGHYIATVSGSVKDVESGNIVTVTSPNGAETKSVVTADGRYTATIDYGTTPPAKGSAVKVSVNDEAGNKAENKVSLDLSTEITPITNPVSITKIVGKNVHLSGNAFRYIDKTHNALDIFDNRGYGGKINKTGDITKELQDGKVLNPQVVAEEYGKTGRMGAAINPRPEQQNSSLFPKREDGQTSRGPIDRTQTINKLEFGDLTGKMSRPGYTNSRSNADVVYYYKGKVTISGTRDQIFATASNGTVAIVKIDGKIVLAQKDGGRNVKSVQKLNGLHDIEVIVIKDSNAISSNVKVGVIGTNGKEVVLGDQANGVETHLISPNTHIPSNVHFNPDKDKFETITYKPEVKVKGGSSDHSNETQDQDSNHDINVEESKMTNGTDKADTINGSDKGEYIDGGKGNDTINGGAGNDHIEGGDGDDIINAGAGNDYINGGAGKDTINAGDGDDVIVFDKNDTKIDGGAGKDTLVVSDFVDFTKLGELKNKVTNIENLELNSQGGKPVEIKLNVKDILDLTGEDNADAKIAGINTLKIDGHNGDKVSLKGEGENWAKKDGVTSDGYVTYEGKDANNHTVHIQIKEDVTIDL